MIKKCQIYIPKEQYILGIKFMKPTSFSKAKQNAMLLKDYDHLAVCITDDAALWIEDKNNNVIGAIVPI